MTGSDQTDGVPLEVLLDTPLPALPLPETLAHLYGGPLHLRTSSLYANFVSSVDGVVALGHEHHNSGAVISGRHGGDRFVMALLRACADAVLIGAGTLRSSPDHRWTAEHVYPAAAEEFAVLRRRLGRRARPRLIVMTAQGDIDLGHPGLEEGDLIVTTEAGAERVGPSAPGFAVRSLGDGAAVRIAGVVELLREEGMRSVLTEGGPTVIGQLLRARLLDELFLTVAPVLFGRSGNDQRSAMVERSSFSPSDAPHLDLVSLRHHGPYIFLQYGLGDDRMTGRGALG